MYLKLPDTYPYSMADFRADNPQVSISDFPSEESLNSFGVVVVQETPAPTFDPAVNALVEVIQPVNGQWLQSWTLRPLTDAELANVALDKSENRRLAYSQEADPLYFKWQRGEATQQQWLDKVAEIKNRH